MLYFQYFIYSSAFSFLIIELTLNSTIVVIIAIVIGVLVLLIIVYYRLFIKKIIEEKNRRFEDEINYQKQLKFAIIQAQEIERKQIAGDLHDEVSNKLNLISLWINNRAQFQGKSYDDLIRQELDDLIKVTRDISHQLSPSQIEYLGLAISLKKLFVKLSLDFQIEVILPEHSIELGFEKEIQLYRIIQEFINNSLKHSQATRVQFYVRSFDQFIGLIYSDNGVGFEENNKNGIGLQNMLSRIDFLDAKFKTRSKKNGGVRYVLIVPK